MDEVARVDSRNRDEEEYLGRCEKLKGAWESRCNKGNATSAEVWNITDC